MLVSVAERAKLDITSAVGYFAGYLAADFSSRSARHDPQAALVRPRRPGGGGAPALDPGRGLVGDIFAAAPLLGSRAPRAAERVPFTVCGARGGAAVRPKRPAHPRLQAVFVFLTAYWCTSTASIR